MALAILGHNVQQNEFEAPPKRKSGKQRNLNVRRGLFASLDDGLRRVGGATMKYRRSNRGKQGSKCQGRADQPHLEQAFADAMGIGG